MSKDILKMAIASKGRLFDESCQILRDSGIQFEFSGRKLVTTATMADPERNFSLGLMRPKDIESMVTAGKIDLGIIGSDTIEEAKLAAWQNRRFDPQVTVQTLLSLGIGQCRLVLAAPESNGYLSDKELDREDSFFRSGDTVKCLEQFNGKTIATSYPRTFNYWTSGWESSINNNSRDRYEFDYETIPMSGSVETAPLLGLADGIVDLVETGTTLKENGLKPLLSIKTFEACLVANNNNQKGDNETLDAIRDRMFQVLLNRGNPDALARQRRYESLARRVQTFR